MFVTLPVFVEFRWLGIVARSITPLLNLDVFQYTFSILTASIDLYNNCHRFTFSCSYIKQQCVVLFPWIVSGSFVFIISNVMHNFP